MDDVETLLKHSRFMRSLAKRLIADEHEAEDAVQQVWLEAIQSPPRRVSRTWLRRVLGNSVNRIIRTKRRRTRRELAAARRETLPSTAEVLQKDELLRTVLDAVLGLSEPYKNALLKRFYEGLPPRVIARREGISVETVRSRVRRGLFQVRQRLDRACDGDRRVWALALLPFAGVARAGAPTNATGVIIVSKTKIVSAVAVLTVLALVGELSLRGEDAAQGHASPAQRSGTHQPSDGGVESTALVGSTLLDRDLDLHGVVVGQDGSPIEGASLKAVNYPWQRTSTLNHAARWEEIAGPQTKSLADGTFRLRLKPGALVSLRVEAAGYASVRYRQRQAGEYVRVELAKGVGFIIRAVDARGEPVAAASVTVWGVDDRGSVCFRRHAPTDATGRTRIQELPSGMHVVVRGFHRRFGNTELVRTQLPKTGAHSATLRFSDGRTLTGRVTDSATGGPIAGASVSMNWTLENATTTDADGEYALRGWTGKGVTDIYVAASGYGPTSKSVGLADVVDFSLATGDRAKGRIVGSDLSPVANAPVSIVGSRGLSSASGRTGRDGRFDLGAFRRDLPLTHGNLEVRPGELNTLVVTAPGHGRYLLDFTPHPERPGTIDLGDIVLPSAHTIAGRVVDSKGVPLSNVGVDLHGHNADRRRLLPPGAPQSKVVHGTSERRFTDDIGRFRFPDSSPGRYTLYITSPDDQHAKHELTLESGRDVLGVEIRLAAAYPVRVIVSDERGDPVPGIIVSVRTRIDAKGGETDANGAVSVTVTSPVVKVYARRGPSVTGKFMPKQLAVSGDPREIRITLAEAQTVSGKVVSPNGLPLPNARLQVRRDGVVVAWTKSDAAGEFEAEVPGRGSVEIFLLGELQAHVKRVALGSTGVLIQAQQVSKEGALHIKVLDVDGAPVVGARVNVIPGSKIHGVTGNDGTVRFTGLPTKEVTVFAFPPRGRVGIYGPIPRKVTPVVGGAEVVLTLRASAHVKGSVFMSNGSPAPEVSVELRKNGRVRARATTDKDGAFTIHIPADEPGPWVLVAKTKELAGRAKGVSTGAIGVRVDIR